MWKIIHTSDWHLGKKLHKFSRIEEQKEFLEELKEKLFSLEVDLLLIAGDLFDSYSPPLEAQEICYSFFKEITQRGISVVAISGNHDSPRQLELLQPLAQVSGIFLVGNSWEDRKSFQQQLTSEVTVEFRDGIFIFRKKELPPLYLVATPYLNFYRLGKSFSGDIDSFNSYLISYWKNLRKLIPEEALSILMTHFFVRKRGITLQESEDERSILQVGGLDEILVDALPEFSYIALGHIHRFCILEEGKKNVVYAGSPLAYSFSEVDQQKYVVLIEGERILRVQPLKLVAGKRLLRYHAESTEDACRWLEAHRDFWVELQVKTERGFTSEEWRKFFKLHPGIVRLIPYIEKDDSDDKVQIDVLNLTVEDAFSLFFKLKRGRVPSQEELELLKRILVFSEGEDDS